MILISTQNHNRKKFFDSAIKKEITFAGVHILAGIGIATFIGRIGIRNFEKTYPGAPISDSGYVSGYFAALRSKGINPFSNSIIENISWPSGLKNHGTLNFSSPLSIAIQWILSSLFHPAYAQFILGFIGVFLTFVITAYALRNLGVERYVITIGATLGAVSPMMLQWWSANPPYAQNWIYVLVIWMSINFCKKPDNLHACSLGLAIMLGVLWTQYMAVFCLIIGVVAYLTVWIHIQGKRIARFTSVFAGSFFCIVFYFIMSLTDRKQVPVRDTNDALILYLKLNQTMDGSKATYFGVCLITLTFFVLLKSGPHVYFLKPIKVFCYSSAILLLLLFSFPKVGDIPLPGRFISLVIPQIRSGWYAAQPIQVILVFIAVFALCEFLRSVRRVPKLAGILLIGAVLIFDNYRIPATELDRWMSPAPQESIAVKALADLPPGAVAHFPWELSNEYPIGSLPTPCIYLMTHRHPIVNSCGINYSSNDRFPTIEQIQKTAGCAQIDVMRSLKIKYLLIEVAYVQPILMSCLKDKNSQRLIMDQNGAVELWHL